MGKAARVYRLPSGRLAQLDAERSASVTLKYLDGHGSVVLSAGAFLGLLQVRRVEAISRIQCRPRDAEVGDD